jgi:hypothetical protein
VCTAQKPRACSSQWACVKYIVVLSLAKQHNNVIDNFIFVYFICLYMFNATIDY